MAVEFVIAAPAFAFLLLLVSAGGQWLNLTGDVGSAARDAARQASIARDYAQAQQNAQTAAQLDLGRTCIGLPVAHVYPLLNGVPVADNDFPQATDVQVVVHCKASLAAFSYIGYRASQNFGDAAVAPLDPFVDRG
jgi:type II secretory pathway pseudopilin PulG